MISTIDRKKYVKALQTIIFRIRSTNAPSSMFNVTARVPCYQDEWQYLAQTYGCSA